MCPPVPEYRWKKLMPEGPCKILLCACLLVIALVVASCAKDVEVRARGQTAISVGVGGRQL
jgi:hypothetical protein